MLLCSWPDDDPSFGSILVDMQIEMLTSELVVIVNIQGVPGGLDKTLEEFSLY